MNIELPQNENHVKDYFSISEIVFLWAGLLVFRPWGTEEQPTEINVEFLAENPHKFDIYHAICNPMLKGASADLIFISKFLQIFISMFQDYLVESEADFFPLFLC